MGLPATLVVLGLNTDTHVSRVIHKIAAQHKTNIHVVDFLTPSRFSILTEESGELSVKLDNCCVPKNSLVWDRVKINAHSPRYYFPEASEFNGFLAQEWRALYRLICKLFESTTVNSRLSRVCLSKPFQQIVAANSGFLVPPTLVSNSYVKISQFVERFQGRTILKTLSGASVTEIKETGIRSNAVLTLAVTSADIEQAESAQFVSCPHFFQQEIDKAYELRVVVVAQQVLAYHIDSQKEEIARVDWRKGQQILKFTRTEISDELREKILKFMRSMNLFTGSLDLIVDKEGKEWFLECNPDGQWLWLDDLDNGAISDAFAQELQSKAIEVTDKK
jgi:hypothetical protein